MRKKRRQKLQTDNANQLSEFTFEPKETDDHQGVKDSEKTKHEICSDVKEFIDSVWSLYSKDGKTVYLFLLFLKGCFKSSTCFYRSTAQSGELLKCSVWHACTQSEYTKHWLAVVNNNPVPFSTGNSVLNIFKLLLNSDSLLLSSQKWNCSKVANFWVNWQHF